MIKKILLAFVLGFCGNLNAQNMNYYYGNIHAHSSYSDGNKDSATSLMTTPLQDFLYAKQSLHIDFYGISEHNHESAGIKSAAYFHKGLADADSATIDGQYIAMYGMEWGVISSGGHVIIYGFDSLCGWDFGNSEIHVNEADYTKLWKTINRKNSFAYLAHPQVDDYDNMFTQAVNTLADSAITGMAMRSGPAFSTNTTYSNPPSGNNVDRYNDALKRGYHLGVGIDHDTHNSVFGRQTDGRLVIMAPILNRFELIEAMRNMHFYSSDDWNTEVNFNINNLSMGSIINNSGNPVLNVVVNDADAENIASIVVYCGVPGSGVAPTQLTSTSNSNVLIYTHNIANNSSYYYYLYITQSDGDKIWSSPIWYHRDDNAVIQTPIADFSNTNTACANYTYTLHDSSLNNPTSWWWSIPGAYPTQSSLKNPVVTFNAAGTFNVTLIVSNQNGNTDTVTKSITVINPPDVTVSGVLNICKGQSTNLTAQGANNYLWMNGNTNATINVQPSVTTTYLVTGFDAVCHDTTLVTVTVTQVLTTPIITEIGSTLFSNYTSGNQWFMGNTPIPGATLDSLPVTQSGIYRLQVTDSAGCVSNMSNLYNFQLNVTSELKSELPFKLFPNPVKQTLYLIPNKFIAKLYLNIYNTTGNSVYENVFNDLNANHQLPIQLKELSKGIYTLRATVDGKIYSSKIEVE